MHTMLFRIAETSLLATKRAATHLGALGRQQQAGAASGAQLAAEVEAVGASAAALLQLGPNNPHSHFQAAVHAAYTADPAAAVHGFQRAREQGSWFWLATAGGRLFAYLRLSPGNLQQVGRCSMQLQLQGSAACQINWLNRQCRTSMALHALPGCRPSM